MPNTTPNEGTKPADEFFWDGPAIDRAVDEAVRQALLRHKLLGQSIVTWENGKCVWVAPEDIVVPDAPAGDETAEPRKHAG